MKITANSFATQNSVIPALTIIFQMEYLGDEEIPISVSGQMQTSDLKIVSNLSENHIVKSTSFNSVERATVKYTAKANPTDYYFHLTAPISKEAIDHIESMREKDGDKSVHLIFDLIVKYLTPPNNPNLAVGKSLTLHSMKIQTELRIQQPTWLRTCAPYFDIGNFILLEMRIPENVRVNKFWSDLYQSLINNVSKMERYILQGDWENVLQESRRFFDNSKIGDGKAGHKKFEQEFQNLMMKAGHTEEGIRNLHNGIWQFFEFTSKYIHDIDKSGNPKPPIATAKEDAYFAFSICVGFLNLLGRKISK